MWKTCNYDVLNPSGLKYLDFKEPVKLLDKHGVIAFFNHYFQEIELICLTWSKFYVCLVCFVFSRLPVFIFGFGYNQIEKLLFTYKITLILLK